METSLPSKPSTTELSSPIYRVLFWVGGLASSETTEKSITDKKIKFDTAEKLEKTNIGRMQQLMPKIDTNYLQNPLS